MTTDLNDLERLANEVIRWKKNRKSMHGYEQHKKSVQTLNDATTPETILALIHRVREMEKDAARLDYIEKNARRDPKMDGNDVFWPTTFNQALRGRTIRDAIDKKMEQTK